MRIKNSFTLTREELANLFDELSMSLRSSRSLEIEVKGNAASLDVGDQLDTELVISENSFALSIDWVKPSKTDVDWRSQFDQDMEEAGLVVEEKKEEFVPYVKDTVTVDSTIPDNIEPVMEPQVEAPIVQSTFPDRMKLNTTTLSYDAGFWHSSFDSEVVQTTWSPITIGEDLDNKKWEVAESEIGATVISPATPTRARRSADKDDDDDLFSALDNIDKKPKKKEKKKSAAVIDRASHKKVRSVSPGIPSAKKVIENKQVEEWKEPTRDDNQTGDDWVKPSDFLKKQNIPKSTTANIPGPRSAPVKNDPPIKATPQEDKWVKPSDRLKAESKKANIPSPDNRKKPFSKPPVAPDKRKKKRSDEKGWAEW